METKETSIAREDRMMDSFLFEALKHTISYMNSVPGNNREKINQYVSEMLVSLDARLALATHALAAIYYIDLGRDDDSLHALAHLLTDLVKDGTLSDAPAIV